MTALDMEILLMQHFDPRANVIVPNVSWGIAELHECDLLILSKAGYATEVEIKVSRSDLVKDAKKHHGHLHGHIRRFYYAVPEKLKETALDTICDRAGLLVAERKEHLDYRGKALSKPYHVITEVRKPQITDAHKWTEKERSQLLRLGCMRILGLKTRLQKQVK